MSTTEKETDDSQFQKIIERGYIIVTPHGTMENGAHSVYNV